VYALVMAIAYALFHSCALRDGNITARRITTSKAAWSPGVGYEASSCCRGWSAPWPFRKRIARELESKERELLC
jgi:hypothetical protein